MINTSKILTVSYGTFSCTLEGFDDSFDTMKAIAEYFRDLAAEDRYFGAEPPTPDAEMLARIAERSMSRRVEARSDQGRIVLRASEDQAEAAPAPAETAKAATGQTARLAPVATPVAPAQDHVQDTVDGSVADDAEEDPQHHPRAETAEDTIVSAADESDLDEAVLDAVEDAEEIDEDNLVAADDDAEEETVAFDDIDADEEEDVTFETAEDDTVELEDLDDTDSDFDFARFESALASADEDAAEDTGVDTVEEAAFDAIEEEELVEIAESDEAFDLAETAMADTRDFDVDEDYQTSRHDAAAFADEIEEEISRIVSNPELAADIAESAPHPQDVIDETDGDDLAINLAAIAGFGDFAEDDAEQDSAPDTLEAVEDVAEVAPQPQPRSSDSVAAKLQRIRSVVFKAEDEAAAPAAAPKTETEAFQATSEARVDTAAEGSDVASQLRARILKMRRTDFDSVIANDQPAASLQEAFADTDADQDAEAEVEDLTSETDEAADLASTLSALEEAELQRELDAAMADAYTDDDAALADDHSEDTPAATDAEDSGLRLRAGSSERDVTRILKQTDSHMAEPESSRRRSAIAHLRAAVAATKAEKNAGGDLSGAVDSIDAYRADLADVVHPRRPERQEAIPTERPRVAPAPLKLVAEQRIDTGATRPLSAVQPRRIAVAELPTAQVDEHDTDADDGEQSGFSEYAEKLGVDKLPDLMEAAAAYLTFVEEMEQFSRPLLMMTVRQYDQMEISREDSLRAFGELLREGKLFKVRGGRFSVSDGIGFKPDQYAVS